MRPSIIPNPGYISDCSIGVNTPYPTTSLAELEDKTISVEESEQRISQMIHDFYHPKA